MWLQKITQSESLYSGSWKSEILQNYLLPQMERQGSMSYDSACLAFFTSQWEQIHNSDKFLPINKFFIISNKIVKTKGIPQLLCQ